MKTIMTLAAVSALAIAAPAAAQSMNTDMDVRIDRLQTEIQANARSGLLTRAEAQQLREELRGIRRIERQYSRNGLTWAERRDLDVRLRNLNARIDYAERSRGTRYGSDTRYGYSGMIDRNRDGWDDRDYDRDGRWTDDVRTRGYGYGMGGPYNEVNRVCVNRGVTGIIGSLLGQDNCLSVGERATGNLSGLPYNLRSQFPDGRGYYHRYLNGDVVQIDARTGTVVRIYDVY